MIAQVCGLKRGEFVHVLGDTHIYKNHLEPLKTQIERVPKPFPLLEINPDVTDIDQFKFDDLKLISYSSHPKIDMPLSV